MKVAWRCSVCGKPIKQKGRVAVWIDGKGGASHVECGHK
jgi:hypothetical protein